jgi:signal transduction histidine kinase
VEERTRIARELHDIVSHSISVVTIQTQAVRRRLGPDHAKEAEDLAAVEATAREALAEMRRLFGVLRSDGESASLTPQPGLHELDRLVEQVRGSGLDVDLEVSGDRYDLPPGVDLAAYRIVQEALTNALRHSGADRARVVLRYGPGRLDIAVEDDGRGLATVTTGGHGLVGVRERVALYDGKVEIGPAPSGGVRLSASLPVRETP